MLPGGRTIAYGSFPLPGSSSSGILAFTASGAIDSTWNGGVPIAWDSSFQIPQRTLVVDAAGRVLAREGTVIARFTSTGAPDATWGGDGRVDLNELFSVGLDSLRIDDLEVDGNKVVVGGTRRGAGSNHVFFARLTDTGGADSTFGGGGYRQLPNQLDTPGATPAEFGGDLERDPVSGNLYLTAGDFVGNHYVVKATPTGAIDTTFSGDGVAPMPGTAFDMVLDTSGRPVTYSPNLAFTDDGRAWGLTRLTTGGTLDATYGNGGVALVPVPDGISSPSDVAMTGNIGYFPTCLCPDGGASTPAVVALDVAAADLVDGFSADGVATVPAVYDDDAGTSAADLTPAGKVRFGIVDFYGGDSGLASAELAQVTTAGVADTAYSDDGHSLNTMTRHRYGELQDLVVAPTARSSGRAPSTPSSRPSS